MKYRGATQVRISRSVVVTAQGVWFRFVQMLFTHGMLKKDCRNFRQLFSPFFENQGRWLRNVKRKQSGPYRSVSERLVDDGDDRKDDDVSVKSGRLGGLEERHLVH